jgi:hypothetical protein
MDALMGAVSSEPEAPEGTTEGDGVTKGKAPVKAEEAAVRESQRPTVDDEVDQLLESKEEESDEEDEPDEDDAEDETEDEEDAESDQSPDEEEDAETDEQPEVLFHMEDGTPVTVDEAKRGYLRQADYTRKTQELAEARQQVQQAFQGREQEREVLAENLSLALSVIDPQLAELAQTDWNALAQNDAYAYAEKRALFDQAQARYNAIAQQSQQIIQQSQAEQAQQRKQMLAQEAEKLRMAMPDFADPKEGPKLRASIAQYARDIGLSEQEAKGITDHRLIVVMDKARRFDELQKGSLSAAEKKVRKAPKKPLRAGKPKTAAERKERKSNDTLARLRQTGSEEDALSLLMS